MESPQNSARRAAARGKAGAAGESALTNTERRMSEEERIAREARGLMLRESNAVLSTLSVDVEGFPFGSITPYCFDRRGHPAIFISRIAQHTKNIGRDPRVSLTVAESGAEDSQAAGRVTLLGRAERIPDDEGDDVRRYWRHFPESEGYRKTHDFDLYAVRPVRARFIAGFGRIHWVGAERFARANPFSAVQERSAVEHMNADHADAVARYCALAGIPLPADGRPAMVGVDGEGFHLRVGGRLHRFPFDEDVSDMRQLRARLVALTRRAA